MGVTGFRDLTSKSPVDRDTVFRIASMTKSFTAMSILKLRDAGKLSLDDPAERYVPELKGITYPTTDSPRITIRHLLSHSTGFPEDNPWGDQQLADSEEQLSQMLRGGIPFSNAPGIARVFESGLCNPGPHRRQRVGQAVHRVRRGECSPSARHDVNDAGAIRCTAAASRPRVPMGGCAVEGRASARERLVRVDGRDADVGQRSEPLRRRVLVGVAAARWT